jgi:hypothetical protein
MLLMLIRVDLAKAEHGCAVFCLGGACRAAAPMPGSLGLWPLVKIRPTSFQGLLQTGAEDREWSLDRRGEDQGVIMPPSGRRRRSLGWSTARAIHRQL